MNTIKSNLQQNLALAARQSGKNKLVQRTFEDNLPQISKKEINKMLDKCQSAGAMRILKKIFLKKI